VTGSVGKVIDKEYKVKLLQEEQAYHIEGDTCFVKCAETCDISQQPSGFAFVD